MMGKKPAGSQRGTMTTHEKWFSGPAEIYDGIAKDGGYYATLAISDKGNNLNRFCIGMTGFPNSGQRALEVGHGLLPLTLKHGYGKVVLLDISAGIQQKHRELLASMPRENNVHPETSLDYVNADIRTHEFPAGETFDLTTAIECFTHIRNSERRSVLEKLATHSNRLFIVDRHRERGDVRRCEEYVNGKSLAAHLDKQGWLTDLTIIEAPITVERDKTHTERFFILRAERPGLPEPVMTPPRKKLQSRLGAMLSRAAQGISGKKRQ